MMHTAWSGIEEVPYCFSRSSIKCQGHTGKINRRFEFNLSKITTEAGRSYQFPQICLVVYEFTPNLLLCRLKNIYRISGMICGSHNLNNNFEYIMHLVRAFLGAGEWRGDAYMRDLTGPSLIQEMACRSFGTKPFPAVNLTFRNKL